MCRRSPPVRVDGHSVSPRHASRVRAEGTLMAMHPAEAKLGTPVILGLPFDANSSWLRGAAGAPPIIRVAFTSESGNSWTETGIDLGAQGAYCGAGGLNFTFKEPFDAIEAEVNELLARGL